MVIILKRMTKRISVIVLCIVMLVISAVPAFAVENANGTSQEVNVPKVTYIENHSKIQCANYYLSGYNNYYYNFLIKIPNGASLNSVTLYDIYGDEYINLGKMINTGTKWINFEYSSNDGDFYMFRAYVKSGVPGYVWEHFGIKLYYDNGDEHYMSTNTSIGSTTEGPGYILQRE